MARKTRSTHEEEPLSANYIVQKVSQYHEALASPSRYNSEIARFEHISAESDLQQALKDYIDNYEKSQRLDIQHYTFKDVLHDLEEVENVYHSKIERTDGFIRRRARFVGDNYDALTPWLGFIPNSHRLNFPSAKLTEIFKIVKKNAENREKILQALLEIQEIILDTQEQQELFASSKQLQEQGLELFQALINSLANLISLLNGKPEFRILRLGRKDLSSEHTGRRIDRILEKVRYSTKGFQDRLSLVENQVINQTDTNTPILAHTAGTENKLDELSKQVQELRAQQQARYQAGIDAQNYTPVFIQDDFPASRGFLPRTQPQSFIADINLFESLGIQPDQSINDVDTILQQVNHFDSPAQEQSQQLLSHEEFTQWMASTYSSALIIKSNFPRPGPGKASTLSALCAILSLNLSKNTQCIVLQCFCGLHEAPNDPVHGPNGLIRSLLAQLLLTMFPFNLDFIDTRAFFEAIKSHSLRYLCCVFRELIKQLPPTARVVCIIDRITSFECDSRLTDLIDVLHIMNTIIDDPHLRPVVKLIATTPFSQTLIAEQEIRNIQCICLQPIVVDGHGMNERNVGVGRMRDEHC